MISLNPGSSCDVCAEEYGPHCMPHSIPCGHVLCASCCNTIVEKTRARLSPVCPFCREQFTTDSVRLIRMDFTTSGWSTPRRLPPGLEAGHSDFAGDLWAKKAEKLLLTASDSRTQSDVRRLELKVAKVAGKKCSVEEVTALHQELQDWLSSDVKQDETTSSLHLSAALLRAILMNHLAHSEASKTAKVYEANLKDKVNELEVVNEKLEAELRRMRQSYSQKSQECQTLRTELSRLKVVATTLGTAPSTENWPAVPTPPTSPPPVSPYSTNTQSPLSRFNSVNSVHTRSVSMSSRPTTPSPSSSARSHTPNPTIPRSHTPAPSIRSHTPASPLRLATPAPPSHLHHPSSPAPPIPPKPRRLSEATPPKMMRSASEEKQDIHERWIPPQAEDYTKSSKYSTSRPPSRASYSISSAARYRDVRSPSPA
ncbi:hypothetical protein BDN72DRAFT_871652 [Pluteus cervinus]|uniref:Uncharacterized protein n=1 Tax=Pluteus cervinus TaxID=181527 RepID=A0ACD3AJC0_9AGAR|nr:hypothetical protein BDN72DRAFT_871652 [Pluteus cervinus]